jgi:DinB superfamily
MAEIDAVDRRVRGVTAGLDAVGLNWQPAPDSWSIGQCLEHLRLANEVYLPSIAAALEGQPRGPVEYVAPGWFSRWFMRNYIEPPTRKRRVNAPGKIVPASRIEPSVAEAFLASNETLRELIWRASEYDVNRTRFKNPFVGAIRFTVGTGLEIVCRHQVRHVRQAERVRAKREFPGASSAK